MVGAEGIEPSTSSASRKHSATELRAYLYKPYYIKDLASKCQLSYKGREFTFFFEEILLCPLNLSVFQVEERAFWLAARQVFAVD